jgi:PhnB protein
MAVNPVPDDFRCVTPYLIVRGAKKAIEFYKKAFGAVETMRMDMPGDRLGHAEIRIDGAPVMLADEFPEMQIVGPETLGGAGVSMLIYVKDVDAAAKRAVDAGATIIKPVQDQFYGDRSGTLQDPFGHKWTLASRKEVLTEEQMMNRFGDWQKQQKG